MNSQYNNLYEDESLQYRNFNQVSFDQIESNPYVHEEHIYRSVSILSSPAIEHFAPSYHKNRESPVLERPTLKKESNKNVSEVPTSVPLFNINTQNLKASEMPDVLMLNHFEVKLPLETLFLQIDKLIRETNGLSYEFNSSTCQWTCVFINGSSHTKFLITVYEKAPKEYLIEGNRLLGDCYSFRMVYSQLKSLLSAPDEEIHESDSFSVNYPLLPMPQLSESNEGNTCFECIFKMAKEKTVDAQCEASKILCDISMDIGLQHLLVERGGLAILRDLINDSVCEWTQQHAIVAVANLSDAKTFQSAIIKEGFLPILFRLACDGPYNTAELRRSAVHILANLCSDSSSEVAKALGHKEVSQWMNRIDTFNDERLRVHASRARDCLSRVVFAT